MKTILVIYTKELITNQDEINSKKKYSFNTESNVNVNDFIKLGSRATLQVVDILGKPFEYYNPVTGDFSNELIPGDYFRIKNIHVEKGSDEFLYGAIIE